MVVMMADEMVEKMVEWLVGLLDVDLAVYWVVKLVVSSVEQMVFWMDGQMVAMMVEYLAE